MCQKCVDNVKRIFPNLPESDIGELLMGATAFPFGNAEYIEKQLLDLKEKTNGTLVGMLVFADNELNEFLKKDSPTPAPE